MSQAVNGDDDLLVERSDGVLKLTLNRPKFRNAISSEMTPVLARIFGEAQADPSVRCILIAGAGEHFSAGGDIAGFKRSLEIPAAQRRDEFNERLNRASVMVQTLLAFDRPIVVRCKGAVAGAGLMFVLAADLVLADETASFMFAHQRMALSPDGGVSWLLPRVVGLRQAKRLLLTAATIGSTEALNLGLVTALHAASELDAAIETTIRALARAPQEATRTAKRLLDQSLANTAASQLDAEREGIVRCVGENDFAEAVDAFLAKRPARFA